VDRNEKFATFSGSVVTGLTLVFCLSPTFWIICFGSLLLIVSFSLLAKFEGLWGPTTAKHWFYILPMVLAPTLGGLLRETNYALWLGALVALAGGFATNFLVRRYPPFMSPLQETDTAETAHSISR
jgi:4-hydroxybenzoate polyprenyltransferase